MTKGQAENKDCPMLDQQQTNSIWSVWSPKVGCQNVEFRMRTCSRPLGKQINFQKLRAELRKPQNDKSWSLDAFGQARISSCDFLKFVFYNTSGDFTMYNILYIYADASITSKIEPTNMKQQKTNKTPVHQFLRKH